MKSFLHQIIFKKQLDEFSEKYAERCARIFEMRQLFEDFLKTK